MAASERLDVYLICNARFHDTNFARLELLKLLAEEPDVWVRVGEDYSDVDAIRGSRLLVTYTCDLCPSEEEQRALAEFIDGGGRWFALHGTSAMLEFVDGKADTPDRAPALMRTLGSRFVAHPPIEKIRVRVTDSNHPLTAGLEDFEVEDEPYYCEFFGDCDVLLDAEYSTPSRGYVREDFGVDRQSHPQMYLHRSGAGGVLYLTLGHCCGKYDMQPLVDVAPISRCSWESPVYYELLRRGIRWGIQKRHA